MVGAAVGAAGALIVRPAATSALALLAAIVGAAFVDPTALGLTLCAAAVALRLATVARQRSRKRGRRLAAPPRCHAAQSVQPGVHGSLACAQLAQRERNGPCFALDTE